MPRQPDPTDPGLSDFEAELAALVPARSRLDRERLAFEAGRLAAQPRRSAWLWPAVAAGLACVALGEAVLLGLRPGPQVVERIVVHEVRIPMEPVASGSLVAPQPHVAVAAAPVRIPMGPPPASASDYDRLRWQVLRFGVESLPEPPLALGSAPRAGSARPPSVGEVLQEILENGGPT